MAEVICPFCGFKSTGEYEIQLHIEEHHTDDSPFVVGDATSQSNGSIERTKASSDKASSRMIGPHTNTTHQIIEPYAKSSTMNGESNGDLNGPYSKATRLSEESMPADTWTKCTRPNCGEYVLLADIDDHLEVHEAIAAAERDELEEKTSSNRQRTERDRSPHRESKNGSVRRSPQKLQKSRPSLSNGNYASRTLLQYFSGTSNKGAPPLPRRPIRRPLHPGRLGRRELGPHAFEDAMPADVRRHLLNDALPRHTHRIGRDGRLYREAFIENETSGLVNILADLCALDSSTEATYFCDPSVRHVTKLRCDGNFCGYWNIQMLLSYLHSKRPPSQRDAFEPLPNVLQIQDTIEQAWENDVCSYGRIETGGVRGTRKWIGTHEAVAYLTQIGVTVEALSFKHDENETNLRPAVLDLLDHIEAYFMSGLEGSKRHRTSYITSLAPIYFQRFGHSMTIVGLERKDDESRNLLIFDPSFETADGMKRLLAGRSLSVAPETLLKAYRRSDFSLSRWEEFEIVVPQPSKAKPKN